jgi:hypothetical protein
MHSVAFRDHVFRGSSHAFSGFSREPGGGGVINTPNKWKELLPTKLQFKVDKNPRWHGSWMLLDALFHYREGSTDLPLKNVMINRVIRKVKQN